MTKFFAVSIPLSFAPATVPQSLAVASPAKNNLSPTDCLRISLYLKAQGSADAHEPKNSGLSDQFTT